MGQAKVKFDYAAYMEDYHRTFVTSAWTDVLTRASTKNNFDVTLLNITQPAEVEWKSKHLETGENSKSKIKTQTKWFMKAKS